MYVHPHCITKDLRARREIFDNKNPQNNNIILFTITREQYLFKKSLFVHFNDKIYLNCILQ